MKNEYLEVNFTSKVKIHRLVTKGLGDNYVRDISLFYSDDGAIFKPYKQGSKIKVKMVKRITNKSYPPVTGMQ